MSNKPKTTMYKEEVEKKQQKSKDVQINIYPEVTFHKVSRYIYSQFAEHLGRCIYGGIWVGEGSKIKNEQGIRCDTIEALKKLSLPALRWPGGCFADNYHWIDGIGPRKKRPRRYNLWWNQPETNQFGTDEFMLLCRLIETEPYICLNVGSGTVEEARSWVEYCNSTQSTAVVQMRKNNGHPKPYNVKFWGIGNENWWCGGNMRPEYYANLYRLFATYVRQTAGESVKLIACGSHQDIPHWDERFLEAMKGAYNLVDYISLHIYSRVDGSDINFSEEEYYSLIASIDVMDKHISRTIELTKAFSSYGHPIGVVMDEWGSWYKEAVIENGLYQQNTMRDAMFAAATFHCFHKHANGLFMTNMAQTANVLQALILTKGQHLIVTPTYHVYEMFRPHQDGKLVACNITNNPVLTLPNGKEQEAISVSVTSSEAENELFLSILNLDLHEDFTVTFRLYIESQWEIIQVRRLTTKDIREHNTFDEPRKVWPEEISIEDIKREHRMNLPPHSITTVRLRIL
ncbi:alpha-N-arabinofuranosidase [Candidatus Sumerlaeota bacterium]|nr:alpha-N-arabinofuranosidase [Candidatus Sumerlaeota bacterium]